VWVEFRPGLRAWRGRLESGGRRGREILGAGFIRERRIVLDSSLRRQPAEALRILTHELYHFAWVRLGNPTRRSWEELLAGQTAKGELGWSAELRKAALTPADRSLRTRRWREYVCESFCDTAAWLLAAGGRRRHDEFTLPGGARRARRRWFTRAGLTVRISI